MQMDKGLDTGAMLTRSILPIWPDDTTGSLHDRLAELGAREIVRLLPDLAAGRLHATPQDDTLANYAAKISKEEARLDWTLSAEQLDRKIRAFNPFPGAYGLLDGNPLKIWQARPVAGEGAPGSLLASNDGELCLACGQGALAVSEVQKAGGRRLPVAAFLAGNPMQAGDKLA
jgi:methionyl-tRNA formyltransferase